MSEPARILIVRLSHLGDVVCTLGILDVLHAAYPDAEIAWAIQPEFAELVEGAPGLSRVIPFARDGGALAWPRLRRELRAFGPALAVDAQGNWKSALVTRLSGAPRRVGFARADWRERSAAWVLTERAPYSGHAHLVGRVHALARHLSPALTRPPRAALGLTAVERSAGAAQFATLLPEAGGVHRPVLLHVTDPDDVRGWPLARWSELIEALRGADRAVLVLSGPAERAAGEALRARHPDVAHRVGQRGLRALAALLEAAAEAGGVLVACDSGPMHLAWAVGLPVCVLEGPQLAARTGPWPSIEALGSPHVEVRAHDPPPCAPCLARRCTHAEGPRCMADLEVERVLAALEPDR